MKRKLLEVPSPAPGHVGLLSWYPELDARGFLQVPLDVLPQEIQDLIAAGRDEFILQAALDDLGMRAEWETATDADARELELAAVEKYSAKRRAEVAARARAVDA
jgi:hypothetical protein